MALIQISETQLLFGYFHSYINLNGPGNFVIPSLRQEGGLVNFPYPGADIVIDHNWLVQFKRPFYFTTAALKEFWHYDQPAGFIPPYYRFHIKNDDPTNQLNNLVLATQNGFTATYISPIFHDEATFFNLLTDDARHLSSYVHIDIAQFNGMQAAIGNNNEHTILYNESSVDAGSCYCFSEPKQLKATRALPPEALLRVKNFDGLIDCYIFILKQFFKREFPDGRNEFILNINYIQERLLIEHNILWAIKWRRKSE